MVLDCSAVTNIFILFIHNRDWWKFMEKDQDWCLIDDNCDRIGLVSVSGNVVHISVCNAYHVIELTKQYYAAGWYKNASFTICTIIHQVSIIYSTKQYVSAVSITHKVRTCDDDNS